MTVAAFDLGLRFRAIETGVPQRRLGMALFNDPRHKPGVTVAVARHGDTWQVRADKGPGSTAESWLTVTNPSAVLDAITRCVGAIDPALAPTLVVDTAETFALLSAAGRKVDPREELRDVPEFGRHGVRGASDRLVGAAVVAWWTEIAEHPGTNAVIVMADALAATYMPPTANPFAVSLLTWAQWLGLGTQGRNEAVRLLSLLSAVCDDDALPFSARSDDNFGWKRFERAVIVDGRVGAFAYPDGHQRAAAGLFSRNTAAELYDRIMLDDPLWRQRQHFAGTSPVGLLVAAEGRVMTLRVTDTSFRFRANAAVRLEPASPDHGHGYDTYAAARVVGTTVDATGALAVEVRVTSSNSDWLGSHAVGVERVAVLPPKAQPAQAGKQAAVLASRFRNPSWITGPSGADPGRIRRTVPLDVIVAAAVDNGGTGSS